MYENVALLAASPLAGFCLDCRRRYFAGDLYSGGILDDCSWYIADPDRHILPLGGGCHEDHVYQGAGIFQAMAFEAAE